MDWPIVRAGSVPAGEDWVRLHRGIYVPRVLAESVVIRAAAAIAAVPGSVASHETAAAVWRLELVRSSGADHVTVPRARRRPSRSSIRVHAADLTAEQVRLCRGLPVTAPSRTLTDLARTSDRLTVVWAIEQALSCRLTDRAELSGCRSRRCREFAALAEERSESPLETGIRLVLLDAGLPRPQLQIPFRNGLYRIDLGYLEDLVGIEADGRSTHDHPDAIYSDRERANVLIGSGWRLLRFTWRDLMQRPDYIVASVRALLSSRAA
jgi:very-short-patch-repair endonuclease